MVRFLIRLLESPATLIFLNEWTVFPLELITKIDRVLVDKGQATSPTYMAQAKQKSYNLKTELMERKSYVPLNRFLEQLSADRRSSETITSVAEFEEALRTKRDYIVKNLNVKDVLINEFSFKHIISEDDHGIILSCYDRGERQKAAGMFVDAILRSRDETKWSVFRDVLESCERLQLIKDILYNGETLSLIAHDAEQTLIQLSQVKIVDKIYAELVSNQFLQEELLSQQEFEEVQAILRQKGNSAANLEMLNMVHQRKNFYQKFLNILWKLDNRRLVKELDPDYFDKLEARSLDKTVNSEVTISTSGKNVCHHDTLFCEEKGEEDDKSYCEDKVYDGCPDNMLLCIGDNMFHNEYGCGNIGYSVKAINSPAVTYDSAFMIDSGQLMNNAHKYNFQYPEKQYFTHDLNNLNEEPIASRTRSKTKHLAEKVLKTIGSEVEMVKQSKLGTPLDSDYKPQFQNDRHPLNVGICQETQSPADEHQQDYTSNKKRLPHQRRENHQDKTSPCDGLPDKKTLPHHQRENNQDKSSPCDGLPDKKTLPHQQRENHQDKSSPCGGLPDKKTLPHQQRESQQHKTSHSDRLPGEKTLPYQQRELQHKTSHRVPAVSNHQTRHHLQHDTPQFGDESNRNVSPHPQLGRQQVLNSIADDLKQKGNHAMTPAAEHVLLPILPATTIRRCVCNKTFVSEDFLKAHQSTNCPGAKSSKRVNSSGILNQDPHDKMTESFTESSSKSWTEIMIDVSKNLKLCSCGKRFLPGEYLKNHQRLDCRNKDSDTYTKSIFPELCYDKSHQVTETNSRNPSSNSNSKSHISTKQTEHINSKGLDRSHIATQEQYKLESKENVFGFRIINRKREETITFRQLNNDSDEMNSELKSEDRKKSTIYNEQDVQRNMKACQLCKTRFVSSDDLKKHQAANCKKLQRSSHFKNTHLTTGEHEHFAALETQSETPPLSGTKQLETFNHDSLDCICCCGKEFPSRDIMIIHRTRKGCAKKSQHQIQSEPSSAQPAFNSTVHQELHRGSNTSFGNVCTTHEIESGYEIPQTSRCVSNEIFRFHSDRKNLYEEKVADNGTRNNIRPNPTEQRLCNQTATFGFQSLQTLKLKEASSYPDDAES